MLLDRLLTKCSEHLSIFAAPVVLDRDYDLSAAGCDQVIDVVRQNVPYVAVDLPHTWTAWTKSVLLQADEVIITAAPDLANLRNAKNIVDLLRQSRRNDSKPRLVINMVNMPKRPEISVKEFESALGLKAIGGHRLRQRDVRSGRQQRPDDRGAQRQGALGRRLPRDRAGDRQPAQTRSPRRRRQDLRRCSRD